MTSIIALKGQPYRFGKIKPEDMNNSDSSVTVEFSSNGEIAQRKNAPKISVVQGKNCIMPPSLALTEAIKTIFLKKDKCIATELGWPHIDTSKNTCFIVNRSFLLGIIQKHLSNSKKINNETINLDSRKMLLKLENSWNTSTLYPTTKRVLITRDGWSDRDKHLNLLPYAHLPLGRIESVGPNGKYGKIYKKGSYDSEVFDVNIDGIQESIKPIPNESKIVIIYIDPSPLPAGNTGKISNYLTDKVLKVIKYSEAVIIDNPKNKQSYEELFRKNLFSKTTDPKSSFFAKFTTHDQSMISTMKIPMMSTINRDISILEKPVQQNLTVEDYKCFFDICHFLYPGDSENLAPLATIKSINEMLGLKENQDNNIRFNGIDEKEPASINDFIGISHLLNGPLGQITTSLSDKLSNIIVVNMIDLERHFLETTRATENQPVFSEIYKVDAKTNTALRMLSLDILDSILLLKKLCNSQEKINPYKILKRFGIDNVTRIKGIGEVNIAILAFDEEDL